MAPKKYKPSCCLDNPKPQPRDFRVGLTEFDYVSEELELDLKRIAIELLEDGKGVLAIDESKETLDDRFAAFEIVYEDYEAEEAAEEEEEIDAKELEEREKKRQLENRRRYREMLITTPNLSEFITGIILNEETAEQQCNLAVDNEEEAKTFIEKIKELGMLPGIRLDTGLTKLFGSEGEGTTQGLDNMAERCEKYKELGCDFAKWRCVYKITFRTPTHHLILSNANVLASFANICQSKGMLPILEVDILEDGDYDIMRCQRVLETALSFLYKALNAQHVLLEGTLLMTNMVMNGEGNPVISNLEEVPLATLTALSRTVPPAVPGILFLSGGQSEEEATTRLNEINKLEEIVHPWVCTFGFGRALTFSALQVWGGRLDNLTAAQTELIARAKSNGDAAQGMYESDPAGYACGDRTFTPDYQC